MRTYRKVGGEARASWEASIEGGWWSTYHLNNPASPPLVSGKQDMHNEMQLVPVACPSLLYVVYIYFLTIWILYQIYGGTWCYNACNIYISLTIDLLMRLVHHILLSRPGASWRGLSMCTVWWTPQPCLGSTLL